MTMSIIPVMITSFFILVFLGIPIAMSMGISGSLTLFLTGLNVPIMVIPQRIFASLDSFSLMSIPLFILAGELMNSAGITKRIVRFSGSIVGHIKGSLAHISILASMLFAGISGSACADAASIGSMLIPAMIEDGYDSDFSVAVIASASCIGPIIPPSICAIVYASMSGLSIGYLFIGNFLPGVIIGLALMLVSYIIAVKRNYKAGEWRGFGYIWTTFKPALSALIMPIIIIGGILSGVFTATEAGVVACVYGYVVGIVTKEIHLYDIKRIFLEAAITASTTMIIIGFAQVMSWMLTRGMLAQILTASLLSITTNPQMIFILLLMGIFVLGFFIDTTALLILAVPVIAPIVISVGIDPYHFACLAIIMAILGACTPPVGVLLFISCGIGKVPVIAGAKALIPFLIVMVILVLIFTFTPQIVTFLPNMIM